MFRHSERGAGFLRWGEKKGRMIRRIRVNDISAEFHTGAGCMTEKITRVRGCDGKNLHGYRGIYQRFATGVKKKGRRSGKSKRQRSGFADGTGDLWFFEPMLGFVDWFGLRPAAQMPTFRLPLVLGGAAFTGIIGMLPELFTWENRTETEKNFKKG